MMQTLCIGNYERFYDCQKYFRYLFIDFIRFFFLNKNLFKKKTR